MSGYAGTPLARKLGLVTGSIVVAIDAPSDYRQMLRPMPEGVRFQDGLTHEVDIVHLFAADRAELERELAACRESLRPDVAVWVSWPKKSSGRSTEVTEDVIREVALPLGFVDVKVCAVDEIWSGLRLVVRKMLR